MLSANAQIAEEHRRPGPGYHRVMQALAPSRLRAADFLSKFNIKRFLLGTALLQPPARQG